MKVLMEIGRRTYGNDDRAINKHRERRFTDDTGKHYVLSRTLSGCPPFFEAYGPYKKDHMGILPRLRVGGKEYWGDGWSWRQAERAFSREIQAEILKNKVKGKLPWNESVK